MADLSHLPPPPKWTPKLYDAESEGDMMIEDDWRYSDRTDVLPSADAVRPSAGPSADAVRTDDRTVIGRTRDAVRTGWRTVRDERADWRMQPAEARRFDLDHFGPDGRSPNPDKYNAVLAEVRPAVEQRIKWHRTQKAILATFYVALTLDWWFKDSVWLFALLVLAVAYLPVHLVVRGRSEFADRPSADDRPDGERTAWMPSDRTVLDGPTLTRALLLAVSAFKEEMTVQVGPSRPMGADGQAVDVLLPHEVSSSDVIAAKHDLATRLDASDARLVLRPHRDRNRVLTIGLFPKDPTTGPPNGSPMARPQPVDISAGVPFGTSDTGIRVRWQVTGAHGFVTGTTRIGKTDSVCLIATGVALDPHARMLMLDPEGMGVFNAFRRRATVIAGTTPEQRRAMADALHELATTEIRNRELAITAWQLKYPAAMNESAVTRDIARNPETRLPYQFVLLDECHALFGDPDSVTRERAISGAHTLVSRGGKYGIWCLFSTQRPTKDGGTPPEILAQCDTRFCLSMTDTAGITAVLRGKWAQTGMDPTALDADDHKGVGFLLGSALPKDLRPWAKVRADWIDANGRIPILDHAVRQVSREDILPAQRHAPEPGTPPTEVMTAEAIDDTDPMHLEALDETFRDDAALITGSVIARLRETYPDDPTYSALTIRGMNTFLAPFGLKTRNVREGEKQGKGLRRVDVQQARNDWYDAHPECGTEAWDAPGTDESASQAASHPETPPEQGIRADGTMGRNAEAPSPGPVEPRLGLVPGHAGHRRHLGQVPLPAVVTEPRGRRS